VRNAVGWRAATADSRKERHLCRFTEENTSDPGFAMRVKNSSSKRHKCRAPICVVESAVAERRTK
jgi:hypothetical protein